MTPRARRFLEDTAVSLGAFAGASVLNYAQIVLCGRRLDQAAFGVLGSLLACVWLSTVVGNTVSLAVTREVARSPRGFVAGPYFGSLVWRRRRALAACAALALVASPLLARALHTGVPEVLATAGTIAALVASSAALGALAGLRRFRLQGVVTLGGAALKLAGTAAILAAAPSVLGAVAGSSLGYLFVAAGVVLALPRAAGEEGAGEPQPGGPAGPLGRRLGWAYFFSYAPFMADQVIAQAVAPGLAGDYAALATIGKLTFHGVAPVLAVLYAYLVAHRDEPALQRRYFQLGSGLALALSLLGAALMSAWPGFVVGTLFSDRYRHVAPELPVFALGVVAFTAAHALALRLLARGDGRMLVPLAAAFALQVGLFASRHSSVADLASNQVLASVAMLAGMLVLAAAPRASLTMGSRPRRRPGRPA